MHARYSDPYEVEIEDSSWSDDQTTAKWSPAHVRAPHWPKRRTPSAAEVRRSVPARPQAPITQPIPLGKTQTAWLYAVTAAIALTLALVASRALLPVLIGEGEAREMSVLGVARAQPSAAPVRRIAPLPAAVSSVPTEPCVATGRARSRQRPDRARARSHRRTQPAHDEPQQRDDEEPASAPDPELVPDMDFVDAPVSERELRIMAASRAKAGQRVGTEPPKTQVDAPAVPASGMLRINSRPWAHLYLDGRLVGSTPQVGLSVSAGEHSVRLVNPQFAMSKTFSVVVGPGENVTRVETLE